MKAKMWQSRDGYCMTVAEVGSELICQESRLTELADYERYRKRWFIKLQSYQILHF